MPTIQQIADSLGCEIHGDPGFLVRDAQSINKAGANDITYVAGKANLRRLATSHAGAVIIGRGEADAVLQMNPPQVVLVASDAQSAFLSVLGLLRPQRTRPPVGISPHAFVSPSAQIGVGTNVYAGVWIGDNVRIGRQCDIHPGVCIGAGCRIGDQTTLFPHVVLYDEVDIGERVRIHASSVIGADGFGYRLIDGRHEKIPHFGTVRIDNDVEIGACSTIDRAMVGETVIGEGTKIDNHVMIAHNCELGRHNVLVSQVGFAGSVTSGDYVVCAGQAGVSDHVHLGDRCVIASTSSATKDVPAGMTYAGTPAQPISKAMRNASSLRKIPGMRETLRSLQTQVEQLANKIDELSQEKPHASKPAA